MERATAGHTDTSTESDTAAAGDGSLVFRFMGSLASTIDPGVHYTSTSESDNFESTQSPGDDREREPEKLVEGSIVAVPRAGSGNPYSNA